MAEASTGTRLERVREILDRAAGASPADYGGLGRFWHEPPDRLEHLTLEGVRLIARAEEAVASCCGGGAARPAGDDESDYRPGRGAASGLVRGLRGQAPFDGSRFPRLPWGGDEVAEEDVQVISDWIDDGLPAEARETAAFDAEPEVTEAFLQEIHPATVEGDDGATHRVITSSDEFAAEHGAVHQRRNLDFLSEAELEKLRYAFRELYALNKWPEDRRSFNNQALVHQNHCQHGWERFLPWHRIYLYEFEQALQDRCPGVTLPYWDWIMPQYCPRNPDQGWIIPRSYKAFLTDETIDWLTEAEPPLPREKARRLAETLAGTHYTRLSEFFADVALAIGREYTEGQYRNRMIDALLAGNSLWYPLRYPAQFKKDGKPVPITEAVHYHYPKPEDIAEIMSLRTFRDFGGGSLYNESFGFLDQNPHNTLHLWTGGMNPDHRAPLETLEANAITEDIGQARNRGVKVAGRRFHSREDMYSQPEFGDMFSNLTASFDPIFWPIHANVDRLWWEWQEEHPHSTPADLDGVLTPWSYTLADTLDISRFGYEYVKSAYFVPVGLAWPVGRFVSKPIDIPEGLESFRTAEVRLHRVPQLPRSCFVRVFLNLPDADAQTPLDSPHYAGYLAVFGHGPCVGGPGHCALPPDRARKHDLRPRHHNTPRNHRVVVTKAARALLDEGHSSLQITLVVIGADYCEEPELLRLEGVSLNFLD